MSRSLDPRHPFGDEIRRIASGEIEKALDELRSHATANRDEAVHAVRKRIKKLRAVLRLTRPKDARFAKSENRRYAQAAGGLSTLRDDAALAEAARRLAADASPASAPAFEAMLCELQRRRDTSRADDPAAALDQTATALEAGRAALAGWQGSRGSSARVAIRGLGANYRRARRALRQARGGNGEALHDLRKRLKDLTVHLRLVRSLWPTVLKATEAEAKRTAEALGDHRDLSLLLERVEGDPQAFGGTSPARTAAGAARERQDVLLLAAMAGAERLLAEKPKAFEKRLGQLARIRRDEA